MTAAALRLLVGAGLDAINVDIKGNAPAVSQYCGIDIEKGWRNGCLANEADVWLEITTPIIPGVNGQDKVWRSIAARIVTEVGMDVPWRGTDISSRIQIHRINGANRAA